MIRPVWTFILVFMLPVAAMAEGPHPSKLLARSLNAEAKPLYEAGVALYRQKEFAKALTQFRAAYKVDADPRLLWNVAVCEKNLEHYVQARALTEQYLSEARDSITESERTEASEFSSSLRSFIATVTVDSVPSGAIIYVDNDERGAAPVTVALDMGQHVFRATKAGFKEIRQTESFAGSSERWLRLPLVPEEARLTVTSKSTATVSLDGRLVGRTPWTALVTPGGHSIEVSERGFRARRQSMTLAPAETRTVDLTLEAESGPVWPWIAGATALAIGVGIGGYFLLRPSDERPAPTNGTLGGHQLP